MNTILGIEIMAIMGRHYLRSSWVSSRSGSVGNVVLDDIQNNRLSFL